jgi:colanic acid/amylovoran biosynthesis protein
MTINNILITDYYSASNRGDAAILEGELAVFKERFPDADITVKTKFPDAAELIHDVDAVAQHIVPFEPSNFLKTGATAFSLIDTTLQEYVGTKLPFSDFVSDKLELQPYREADVIVSTGGQFITGDYYPDKLGVHIEWYLAKLLGKPLVVYGQSLGPFPKPYRTMVRHALNQSEVIITRDELSKEHLDDLGVATPVHVGVDAAWAMPLESGKSRVERMTNSTPSLPEPSDGPLVTISARNWSHFNAADGQEQYFKAVANTAASLIEDENAEIAFLSTCTGLSGYHTDDRVAAANIIDYLDEEYQDRVTIISEELTPQQLVTLYGQVDLHIGTRMHSCILSILAGTPFAAIEYQFKTSGLMSQFGLEDYVVSIDGLNHASLLELANKSMEDSKYIKNQIDENLPEVQQKARENAEIAAEYIRLISH